MQLQCIFLFCSVVTSSQPVRGVDSCDSTDDSTTTVRVVIESLTQPSRFDELIIGTQIPCTPGASQVNITCTDRIVKGLHVLVHLILLHYMYSKYMYV